MGLRRGAPPRETWEIISKSLEVIAPWTYPRLKRDSAGDLFLFFRAAPNSGRMITYSRRTWFWQACDITEDYNPVADGFSTRDLLADGSAPVQYIGECALELCIGGLEGYVMASERDPSSPDAKYVGWARSQLDDLRAKGLY